MNTITKKVRLIPAPFVGSILTVCIGEGLKFKIRNAALSSDSEKVVVDWGDGTTEEYYSNLIGVEHNYPKEGVYLIRFSDALRQIGVGYNSADSEYTSIFAPMVLSFFSNATRLAMLHTYAFCNCVNLQDFDVSAAPVMTISTSALKNCSSLEGALRFPFVITIHGGETSMPFMGCDKVTELHFGEANEEIITTLPVWEASHHKLGAENAVVKFDL